MRINCREFRDLGRLVAELRREYGHGPADRALAHLRFAFTARDAVGGELDLSACERAAERRHSLHGVD